MGDDKSRKQMEQAALADARKNAVTDNPAAPLKVQLWTDKQAYKQREKVRIYLTTNPSIVVERVEDSEKRW